MYIDLYVCVCVTLHQALIQIVIEVQHACSNLYIVTTEISKNTENQETAEGLKLLHLNFTVVFRGWPLGLL